MMSSAQENSRKLRRLLEDVVPSGNFEVLAEYVHEDVVLPTDMPGGKQGLIGYKEGLAFSHEVIRYTHSVTDTVADGDKVAARIVVKGRQIGPIMGLPNTGREFVFEQMVIAEFRSGRIIRFWRVADLYSLLRQLSG